MKSITLPSSLDARIDLLLLLNPYSSQWGMGPQRKSEQSVIIITRHLCFFTNLVYISG